MIYHSRETNAYVGTLLYPINAFIINNGPNDFVPRPRGNIENDIRFYNITEIGINRKTGNPIGKDEEIMGKINSN